jgi:AraC-like DNA-binding protein
MPEGSGDFRRKQMRRRPATLSKNGRDAHGVTGSDSRSQRPSRASAARRGAAFGRRRHAVAATRGSFAMTIAFETAIAGEGRRAPGSPAERVAGSGHNRSDDARCDAALVAVARRLLLADLREPPTIPRLARRLGVGGRRLSAAFRAVLGRTVVDVVREARLEAARRAIETRDAPLKQIAWEVGYGDVTNFIHAFRNRYGAPPRRFQKAAAPPDRRLAA